MYISRHEEAREEGRGPEARGEEDSSFQEARRREARGEEAGGHGPGEAAGHGAGGDQRPPAASPRPDVAAAGRTRGNRLGSLPLPAGVAPAGGAAALRPSR